MANYSYNKQINSDTLIAAIREQTWGSKVDRITTSGTTAYVITPTGTSLTTEEKSELDTLVANHDGTPNNVIEAEEITQLVATIAGYFATQEGALMAAQFLLKNALPSFPKSVLQQTVHDIMEATQG